MASTPEPLPKWLSTISDDLRLGRRCRPKFAATPGQKEDKTEDPKLPKVDEQCCCKLFRDKGIIQLCNPAKGNNFGMWEAGPSQSGLNVMFVKEGGDRLPEEWLLWKWSTKRWKVALKDCAVWSHPKTGRRTVIGVFMDQGSRFMVAKVFVENARHNVKRQEDLQYFREHWQPHFGNPEVLRFDAEGT